jgi:hypothetical protein
MLNSAGDTTLSLDLPLAETRCMHNYKIALIAALLTTIPFFAQAAEAIRPAPIDLEQLVPVYQLKVIRLTGLAADGKRLELMSDTNGVVLPVDDFSLLADHLNSDRGSTTEVYHTLEAELAPGVYVRDVDGNVVPIAQQAKVPKVIPLQGAVLSQGGEMSALGIAPELIQPELRCRYQQNGHHDAD